MKIVNLNKVKKFNDEIEYLIIGHFNTIHKGHLKLIKKYNNISFLIFENNPSKSYCVYDFDQRVNNLKQFNPQYVLCFDILKNNVSAIEFINDYLLKMNIKHIIVGSDYVFGKNKSGDIKMLKKYFDVIEIKNDNNISTSKIIELIQNGEIDKANKLSAFNLYYYGEVIKGKQIASKNFFPTANLIQDKNVNIKSGSYISKTLYKNKWYPSISFIGIPKSIETNIEFVETYIFNFNKMIYGEKIKVELLKFIRENQKFNSFSQLIENINNDLEITKKYFENNKII